MPPRRFYLHSLPVILLCWRYIHWGCLYSILSYHCVLFFFIAFRNDPFDSSETCPSCQWGRFPAWCHEYHQWLWCAISSFLCAGLHCWTSHMRASGHWKGRLYWSTLTSRKILKAASETSLKALTPELKEKSPTISLWWRWHQTGGEMGNKISYTHKNPNTDPLKGQRATRTTNKSK